MGGEETTILFVAANPIATPQIQLDEEARGIAQELRMSTGRDAFRLQALWGTRPLDLLRGIDQYSPQILHFAGHGQDEGIVLADEAGQPIAVSGPRLAQLLAGDPQTARLVILNGCSTDEQSAALVEVVGCVIAMNAPIGDGAARRFSQALYAALAEGRSVQRAFEQAVALLAIYSRDHGAARDIEPNARPTTSGPIPVLRHRADVSTTALTFAPRAAQGRRWIAFAARAVRRRWRQVAVLSAALAVCAGLALYLARRQPELPPFDASGGIVVAGPNAPMRRALCDALEADQRKTEPAPHCVAIDDEPAARSDAERARAALLVFVGPARVASVVPLGPHANRSFFGDVPVLDLSANDGVKRAALALRTLAQVVSPALTEALVRCAPASTGPLDNIDLLALVVEQFSTSCRDNRQNGGGLDRSSLLDVCPKQPAVASWGCRAARFLLSERGATGEWRDLAQLDGGSDDPHIAVLADLERAQQACDGGDAARASEIIGSLVPRFTDSCGPLTAVRVAACTLFVAADAGSLDSAHRQALQAIVDTLDRNGHLPCDRALMAEAYAGRGYWRLRAGHWREAADDYAHAYQLRPEPADQLAHIEALLHQRGDAGQAQAAKRELADLGELRDPALRVQLQLLRWILQPDLARAEQLRNAFAALRDGALVYADAQDPSLRSLACPLSVGRCVYEVLSEPRSSAAVGRLEKALALTGADPSGNP